MRALLGAITLQQTINLASFDGYCMCLDLQVVTAAPLHDDASRQAAEAQLLLNNLSGVILDSSPAPLEADVAARALVAALARQPAPGAQRRYPLLVGGLRNALAAYMRLGFIREQLDRVRAAAV